jgi:Peptidase A4 family
MTTMSTKKLPNRRALPVLALGTLLALSGGFAVDAVSASAHTVNAQQQVSGNWSGYVAQSSNGQNFSKVSGSWTQPAVSNSTEGYSAFWVGLGGASQQSQALEQVGTSADTTNGQPTYYAWYELVPAAEQKLDLAIHPGDHMTGSVTVNGSNVTVSLSNKSTGQSVTKNLTMNNPDTSSAEWIAEAPSAQSQSGDLQTLPLANFGKVTFTDTSATAGGHTGSLNDPDWTLQQVNLQPAGANGALGGGGQVTPAGLEGVSPSSSAGASASDVSGDGSSFSVSYSSGAAQSSQPVSSDTGGDGNPGGYVYVYPYGYPGDGGYIYGD